MEGDVNGGGGELSEGLQGSVQALQTGPGATGSWGEQGDSPGPRRGRDEKGPAHVERGLDGFGAAVYIRTVANRDRPPQNPHLFQMPGLCAHMRSVDMSIAQAVPFVKRARSAGGAVGCRRS